MRTFLSACGVLSLILSGCLGQHDCFQVEIRPEGEAFRRQLTGWHAGDACKTAFLRATHSAPGSAACIPRRGDPPTGTSSSSPGVSKEPRRATSAGRSCTCFASSLGSTWCYVERFRGDDDLASQLARRHATADRLVDVLVGWFGSELGKEPHFPVRSRSFSTEISGGTCTTSRSTRLSARQAKARKGSPTAQESLGSCGRQHFSERGYFTPEQPLRSADLVDGDGMTLLRHVQCLAIRGDCRVRTTGPCPRRSRRSSATSTG